jgi:dipeptidyl aminopeptidase/acylaminoacyl peptidase
MHECLKKKGIATEYHLYQGEGHGFRRAETVQHALKAEHTFFARFFGFDVQPEDRV